MAISRGGFEIRTHTFVRLTCEDGFRGYGEAVGNPERVLALLRHGTDWQGKFDRFSSETSWGGEPFFTNEVYVESLGSSWAAESAIEMASVELWSKRAGVSAQDLLGTKRRSELTTYASNVYWDSPENMAAVAAGIVARGIRAVKIHVGRESPEREAVRIAAVRDAIGPDSDLMIDLNGGYSLSKALLAMQLWEEYRPFWVEEPLIPYDFDGLEELSKSSSVPIAVGENIGFELDFARAANSGARILMPDVARIGLARGYRIAELCDELNVMFSPHNYASGVLAGATTALLAVSPRDGLLEVDLSGNGLYAEIFEPIEAQKGGKISIPAGPGFGLCEDSGWAPEIRWSDVFVSRQFE